MIRQALIFGGVAYHYGIIQPGQPLADCETIDIARLASIDLNTYDLVIVPRSADGEILHARRHQLARFLDHGGVLLAFGELWANWFPGCQWREECAEDILAPVVTSDHPIVTGYTADDLYWHPAQERWCCHGHLVAPPEAEVLVRNTRGDAWLYIDRKSTNGVILASSNLDPDTHTFHGSQVAREFFDRILIWAKAEAAKAPQRRQRRDRKIAGLYSGVHFQQAFYTDPEFASRFALMPIWELAAANLHLYAALWIPRESNQYVLMQNHEKLSQYLAEGGVIVCFDEVVQPWLPTGLWRLRPVNLDTVRVSTHPVVANLTPDQVRWHSHGAYEANPNADILVDDGQDGVMLFLDERSFSGKLLAGTIDPDCHAGFGAGKTRPLLRAILAWLDSLDANGFIDETPETIEENLA